MFGTIVVATTAFSLVSIAVAEMADAIVDHRRLNRAPQRSAAPQRAEAQILRPVVQQPEPVFAKAA